MGQQLVGWLCCVVACLGFGSSYLPVKQVDVRDGWFFTLWLSVGILVAGMVQWALGGFYRFEPFAMLGGAIWATGNLLVPMIIRKCGLGVGQLLWGSTNMLTGWAVGAFGLFGKNRDPVAHRGLNYAGVALAVLALGLFALMRPEGKPARDVAARDVAAPEASEEDGTRVGVPARPPPGSGFAVGCGAALLAGLFFGSNFNPPTYLQQQGQADEAAGLPEQQWRHSPYAMDYVFSHFCGVFASTAVYFAIRCAAGRGRPPYTKRDVVLPGLASGTMWAIAQIGWFKANSVLSFVIAFPIIVGVPGVIAAIWGAALFGENSGRRNRVLLLIIIFLQAAAVTLIAMSKGS